MAVDMFLKLDGIDGESRDSKHKDEIDVLSFNMGANNVSTGGVGGGGGAGRAEFHDLAFVMFVDKASPKLFESLATGKHIATGLLTVRKAGETQVEFLKWTLTDVVVTGVSQAVSGGEDRRSAGGLPRVQKVKIDYTEQTDKGTAGGTTSFAWDLAANKKI